MEKSQQIEIDLYPIDEIDSSMQNKLGSLHPPTGKCCIYKIPTFLRDENEKCYRPSIISIGPVYYRDKTPELETTQELKWIYLQKFLSHSKNAHQNNLLPFLNYVKQHEQEIRESYEQQISREIGDKEFIEMIVLDAAFIIYFFAILLNDSPIHDSFVAEKYQENLIKYITEDLFLMENQLPFFVLNDIFDIAFGHINPPVSFIDLTLKRIRKTNIPGSKAAVVRENIIKELSSAKHLLDFWWILCCLNFNMPGKRKPENPPEQECKFPKTAKQLRAAGVKLKASKSKNPLEIKFNKGVLEIPTLCLDDMTETLLRNILFFEQCHYQDDSFFIDYISFLDELIDSVRDIQILSNKDILDNWLGSVEEARDIFNKITKYTMLTPFNCYYSDISRQVNEYEDMRTNRWKAILKTNYFNNPWAIISVIAAVVLFILTLLQTITGFTKK